MRTLLVLALFLATAALAACNQAPSPPVAPASLGASTQTAQPPSAPATIQPDLSLPLVTVHKSPYCGCCKLRVDHMRAEGFEVKVIETEDMGPVKQRVGIPPAKGSCHTAEVDGYFVEGHVPAEDVKRLLAERPKARGLTVPGPPARGRKAWASPASCTRHRGLWCCPGE